MNIIMIIAVFLLGVITGSIGIMILCCSLMNISNKKARELTKEEWQLGLHPDQVNDHAGIRWITAAVIIGISIYIITQI